MGGTVYYGSEKIASSLAKRLYTWYTPPATNTRGFLTMTQP